MDKYKKFSVPFGLLAGLIIFLGLVGCQDIFLLKQWGTINNMQYTPTISTLTWSKVDGADVYEVLILASRNDSGDIDLQSSTTSSLRVSSLLRNNTEYSWKVRALDLLNSSISRAGAWSETSTFTVSAAALSGTLIFEDKIATVVTSGTHSGAVNLGGLTAGSDYELSISPQVSGMTIDNAGVITIPGNIITTDAGQYTVTATGLGNYTGVVEDTFELTVNLGEGQAMMFNIAVEDDSNDPELGKPITLNSAVNATVDSPTGGNDGIENGTVNSAYVDPIDEQAHNKSAKNDSTQQFGGYYKISSGGAGIILSYTFSQPVTIRATVLYEREGKPPRALGLKIRLLDGNGATLGESDAGAGVYKFAAGVLNVEQLQLYIYDDSAANTDQFNYINALIEP